MGDGRQEGEDRITDKRVGLGSALFFVFKLASWITYHGSQGDRFYLTYKPNNPIPFALSVSKCEHLSIVFDREANFCVLK